VDPAAQPANAMDPGRHPSPAPDPEADRPAAPAAPPPRARPARRRRGLLQILSGSLVRRYSVLLLASAVLPLAFVGVVYDRYTRGLLDHFTGAQLDAQLAGTASRLSSFLEGRMYQLQILAKYPAAPGPRERSSGELASLVRLEADEADLYGILFFSEDGGLAAAVPGQAASGPPYWAESPFTIEGLPRKPIGEGEIVGPAPPRDGQSGWFLLKEPLHGGGTIAAHVRLASLTELLGAPSLAGVVQPVLRTPVGDFDVIGRPVSVHGQLLEGPEIAPGWRPCLVVDPVELLRPFQAARYTLIAGSLLAIAAIGWASVRMARRLSHRVDALAKGAERLSGGDFSYRVPDSGEDEVGLFAVTFNQMAARLGELIDRTVRMERLAALGRFSTGIAHEVRNPLATLKTTVQALERLERDAQRSALLRDMGREIDRMARTMGEILAFGRPRPPERQEVLVSDTMDRLRGLVATIAEQRQVELTVRGEGEPTAIVDSDHLQQILMNLALNAIQATPPGGRVTLAFRPRGGRVLLEVRDTGAGIAPDALREVFEPFYTTKPAGTGLGLSISRQLTEMNGGSLALESAPGRGTTARVVLPARGGAAPTGGAAARSGGSAP
jgi:two-component system, NtrC family, sensor histidine kinase HydH